MMPRTCGTESEVILAAQLGFIRTERQAQWHDGAAFRMGDGTPTPRMVRLAALCDAVTDQLLGYLVQTEDWARVLGHQQTLIQRVVESLVWRIGRYGDGMPDGELVTLEAATRRELLEAVDPWDRNRLDSRLWPAKGTRILTSVPGSHAGAEVVWWPSAIPLAVVASVRPTRELRELRELRDS